LGKNAKETKRAVKPRASRLAGARGQSPRIKAQKRRGNKAVNSTANFRPKRRGNKGTQSVDKFYVHALSASVKLLPRPPSNSEASLTARPERREGRKLTNQCPKTKPSTSTTKHRPKIKIQLSVIWTSRVRSLYPEYCGIRSPLTGREINELSPLISGAAIIYANSKSVDGCLSTL